MAAVTGEELKDAFKRVKQTVRSKEKKLELRFFM
jgi:uncharacterized protein YktA (UPF0223 family)